MVGNDSQGSPSLACVLIDFALSAQSDAAYDVEATVSGLSDDWGRMLHSICLGGPWSNDDGCPAELLKEHYGGREIWDYARTSFLD